MLSSPITFNKKVKCMMKSFIQSTRSHATSICRCYRATWETLPLFFWQEENQSLHPSSYNFIQGSSTFTYDTLLSFPNYPCFTFGLSYYPCFLLKVKGLPVMIYKSNKNVLFNVTYHSQLQRNQRLALSLNPILTIFPYYSKLVATGSCQGQSSNLRVLI